MVWTFAPLQEMNCHFQSQQRQSTYVFVVFNVIFMDHTVDQRERCADVDVLLLLQYLARQRLSTASFLSDQRSDIDSAGIDYCNNLRPRYKGHCDCRIGVVEFVWWRGLVGVLETELVLE